MSFDTYNGSAVVAMAGKNCVAIASDSRLGVNRFTTVGIDNVNKLYEVSPSAVASFPGLFTDSQTFYGHLRYRLNLLRHEEGRAATTEAIVALVSTMLYEKRFSPWMLGPIVAGLDKNNAPLVSSYDMIGSCTQSHFVTGGSASDQLQGLCQAFWRPDLEPDDLFETISQVIMAGIDKDCLSGWGAEVVVLTPEKIMRRNIKTRMD